MELRVNAFKSGLRSGRVQFGFWAGLCAPNVTEILGTSGADWVCIDTEHAANELPDVIHHLRTLRAAGCAAVVRPAWNDMVLVKRLLDGGAESLVVPYVQTEAEARAAVAATRYPPAGVRGVAGANRTSAYGRVKDYLRRAQDEIAIVVQIETRMAMDNLEAIVGVEGIDGILIGPGDLAASLGHLGDPGHPEVREAIAEIARRTLAAGSAPGMFCMGEVEVEQALGMGFRFISMGIDIALMRNAADALVRRFRP